MSNNVTVDTYVVTTRSATGTFPGTACSGSTFTFDAPAPYAGAPVWSVNGQIGAVEIAPSDLPGFTNSVQQSLSASLQAQWSSAGNAAVSNGTIYFAWKAPYAGTIQSLDYFTGNGSFVVSVAIGGVAVPRLTNVVVNSPTPATIAAGPGGANTFTLGQSITGGITSAVGNPTNALLNLNISWS